MAVPYDEYYQTNNLFGKPYPELIDYYSKIKEKGRLLDLGCGQGRDSIPLARLGFSVTGIDNSIVGISQLNEIAKAEKLPLIGIVADIYAYSDFGKYDFIILDSMFHFGKKEKDKEIELLTRIIDLTKLNTLITICIQDSGEKVNVLNEVIASKESVQKIHDLDLIYIYEDKESNHSSESKYKMITVRKLK